MAFGSGDGANRQLGSALIAASGAAMLLGGIAAGPDAPWFFKFVGPAATVREQRDAFVELLKSVEPGAPEA